MGPEVPELTPFLRGMLLFRRASTWYLELTTKKGGLKVGQMCHFGAPFCAHT